MTKLKWSFFNPFRHYEPIALKNPECINWEDIKSIWKHEYKIYRGISKNDQADDDKNIWLRIFYSDAYFPLIIGLCQAINNPDEVDSKKLQSNLGIFHYLNPAVLLSLFAVSISVECGRLAKKYEKKYPKISNFFKVLGYAAYFVLGVPSMLLGFFSQVVFTAVHALLSALFATISTPFTYMSKLKPEKDDLHINPLLDDSSSSSPI